MLNAYNDHGQTALHIARLHSHTEIALILVEAGAANMTELPCIVVDCNNQCRQAHDCSTAH